MNDWRPIEAVEASEKPFKNCAHLEGLGASSCSELFLLKLRNLIADKENLTARLNRDVAQYGSAQVDFDGWFGEIDRDIRELLSQNAKVSHPTKED
jgi:hypothetical protein